MAVEASDLPRLCHYDDDYGPVTLKWHTACEKITSNSVSAEDCDDDDLPLSAVLSQFSNVGTYSSNCNGSVKKRPMCDKNSFHVSVKKSKVSSDDGDEDDDKIPISRRIKRLDISADKSFSEMKEIVVKQLALVEKTMEQCRRKSRVEEERLQSLEREIEECSKELRNKKMQVSCVRRINEVYEQIQGKIEECVADLVEKEAQLQLMEDMIRERKTNEIALHLLKAEKIELCQIMDGIDKNRKKKEEELKALSKKNSECTVELKTKEKELDAMKELIAGQAKELEFERKGLLKVMSLRNKQHAQMAHFESMKEQFESQAKEIESKQKQCERRFKELEAEEKHLKKWVKELESKEKKLEGQRKEFESQKEEFEGQVKEFESEKKHLESLERELKSKENQLEGRLKALDSKENQLGVQVKEFELEKKEYKRKIKELELRKKLFESQLKELKSKEKQFEGKVKEHESEEKHLEGQWNEFKSREEEFDSKVEELKSREKQFEGKIKEYESKENHLAVRWKEFKSKEEEFNVQAKEHESKEKQFEARVREFDSKENQLEGWVKVFQSREQEFEGRVKEIKSIMKRFEVRVEDLRSKEKQFKEQVKELGSKENMFKIQVMKLKSKGQQFEGQVTHLESRQNKFDGQLKDLELREKSLIKSFEGEKESGKKFSPTIDGSLHLATSEQRDESELLGNEILVNLLASSDPSKLVLDIIQNPILPQHKEGDNVVIIDDSHIVLLEQLKRISPQIKPHVREEAMKLALDLKASISRNTENSVVVLGFLHLLSIYGLVSSFDGHEILKLFEFAAQYPIAIELFRTLGFADKISDFVQILIQKQQYIEAVRFICSYNLTNKYNWFISCENTCQMQN